MDRWIKTEYRKQFKSNLSSKWIQNGYKTWRLHKVCTFNLIFFLLVCSIWTSQGSRRKLYIINDNCVNFNGISWLIRRYVFEWLGTQTCFYITKEIWNTNIISFNRKISWRRDSRSIGFPYTDLWWCRAVCEREVCLQ